MKSHSGAILEIGELDSFVASSFANEGNAFVVSQMRPENCNDAQARFESDMRDVRAKVTSEFPELVAKNLPLQIDKLKSKMNASTAMVLP